MRAPFDVRHSSVRVAATALFAVTFVSRAAPAQSSYRSAPLGGRSLLMGGTGVALATDGSGPFVNPATTTRVVDPGVAFSVNLYTLSVNWLGAWMTPGPIDRATFGDVTANGASTTDVEFRVVPATLCLFLLGTHRPKDAEPTTSLPAAAPASRQLALCFGAVERTDLGLTGAVASTAASGRTTRISQSIEHSWVRYAVGPTYAQPLSDAWSIGASLHGRASLFHAAWTASALGADADGANVASSSYREEARALSLDLSALVGATYRDEDTTIGASIELPSLHLYGRAHAYRFAEGPPSGATASTIADGEFVARAPLQLHAGVAREWDTLTLEADTSIAFGKPDAYEATLDGSRATTNGTTATTAPLHVVEHSPTHLVVNGAVGGEVFVTDRISVLGGLHTDFASPPKASLADPHVLPYFVESRDRVGGSIGLGSYGEGGELLVGVDGSYGFGDRLVVDAFGPMPSLAPTPHHDVTFTLVIAGSTSRRALRRAARDVKTLVTPGQ